jgi:predicted metalloprotease with PDZ domain
VVEWSSDREASIPPPPPPRPLDHSTTPPRYSLSWRNPRERLFNVSLTFTAPDNDPLLWLPSWRPGRYLIMNFAANVRDMSANATKCGKSSWRVAARRGEEVTLTYRYYAGVLDAGSSFLDDDEAYFNGSNLFVCVDALRREPCTLRIETDWPVETQLPRGDDGLFHARDYDHLIDSPTIASPHMTVHAFDNIRMVWMGDADGARYIEPVRKIVREHAALFGGVPCPEYRFLYHLGDRWHGVEHEDSSSIIVKRTQLDTPDHFLSITSHEFFHLWNVKRIVPAAFTPYDYSRETPTKLLWAMEGITSYYGDLALVRSGIWSEEQYLEHLRSEIETLEASPGRFVRSLGEASFDGWLHEQMHDRGNVWFSFYNKGEIVAALLDLALRREGRSLDAVMRTLWRDYGQTGRGVEEDALERITGMPEFFARYVDGVEPLPYAELFAAAGVAFVSRPRPASLGASLKRSDGTLVVQSVTRGGAAMAAGLLPHDELIAVGGLRVRQASEVERLTKAESPLAVVYARGGVLRQTTLTPQPDGSADVELTIAEPDNALRREWLRRTE